MRKTKLERIAELEKELQEIEALKKKLEAEQREDDRKRRTSRLCERGGFIESVLPETIKLDKAQFQDFIKRTLLTEYSQRELNKLLPAEAEITAENAAETTQAVFESSDKPADKTNAKLPKQA